MSPLCSLLRSIFADSGAVGMENYLGWVDAAFQQHPPPFGLKWYGEKYRKLASRSGWLEDSLRVNAEKEAAGADWLGAFASVNGDSHAAKQILRHALDEARHARIYLALLQTVFPNAKDAAKDLEALNARHPVGRVKALATASACWDGHRLLDNLIQINLVEMRTLVNQMLMRPVLRSYCGDLAEQRMQSLLNDEVRHLSYTARIIQTQAVQEARDFVETTIQERVARLNELTLVEVGRDQCHA